MSSILAQITQAVPLIPFRLQSVIGWYLLSLILPVQRHSLASAALLSGKTKAAFSRLLLRSRDLAARVLYNLAIEESWSSRKALVPGSTWTIAIIIDSTIKNRSSVKVQNSQKFNHGTGFEIGHQFTNIAIVVGDRIIPLRPIPFFTKIYCKSRRLSYGSEHERIIQYLRNLDLTEIVGEHRDCEVVVLCDSGYDNRKLYNAIIEKGWDIVASLRSNSHVDLENPMNGGTRRVDELFQSVKDILWETVYAWKHGEKKKRKDFRACAIRGVLKGLAKSALLVCSEPRRDRQKQRKYLICSDSNIAVGVVVRAYRLRWMIETFHRDVKSYLGFQDIAAKDFQSVEAHVNWVYVSYVVLRRLYPGATIHEAQQSIHAVHTAEPMRKILRLTGRYSGMNAIKNLCYEAIERNKAA